MADNELAAGCHIRADLPWGSVLHTRPPAHLSSSSSSDGQKEAAGFMEAGSWMLSVPSDDLPGLGARGTWTWRVISCDDIEVVTLDCGRRDHFSCAKLFLDFPLSGSASDRTRWRTDTCQGTHKRGINCVAGNPFQFILGRNLKAKCDVVFRYFETEIWHWTNLKFTHCPLAMHHLSSGPKELSWLSS